MAGGGEWTECRERIAVLDAVYGRSWCGSATGGGGAPQSVRRARNWVRFTGVRRCTDLGHGIGARDLVGAKS